MNDRFNPIMSQIVPVLRMLSSNSDGEAINAVRALLRILAAAGLDIHALVDRLEHGGDEKLSAGEMQKIYDAAYAKGHVDGAEQGRRSAVIAAAMPMSVIARNTDDVGDGVNGYSWLQIAQHCADNSHLFSGKSLGFVQDIPEKIASFGRPTPPQAKWLRDLFMQKFRGRID